MDGSGRLESKRLAIAPHRLFEATLSFESKSQIDVSVGGPALRARALPTVSTDFAVEQPEEHLLRLREPGLAAVQRDSLGDQIHWRH